MMGAGSSFHEAISREDLVGTLSCVCNSAEEASHTQIGSSPVSAHLCISKSDEFDRTLPMQQI